MKIDKARPVEDVARALGSDVSGLRHWVLQAHDELRMAARNPNALCDDVYFWALTRVQECKTPHLAALKAEMDKPRDAGTMGIMFNKREAKAILRELGELKPKRVSKRYREIDEAAHRMICALTGRVP